MIFRYLPDFVAQDVVAICDRLPHFLATFVRRVTYRDRMQAVAWEIEYCEAEQRAVADRLAFYKRKQDELSRERLAHDYPLFIPLKGKL
jgi:hypothetical protein